MCLPCGRGGWRGRIWPKLRIRPASRHRDALRGGRAGYLAPRARRVLAGRAAGCFPAREAGSSRQPGRLRWAWPEAPEPPGAWVVLSPQRGERQRGERHPARKSTPAELNSVNPFRVLGISLPIMFGRPRDMSSTLWPKRRNSLILFYFLPAMRCVHFFVLFGSLATNVKLVIVLLGKGFYDTASLDY